MNAFIQVVTALNERIGKICSFLMVPLIGFIVLELALRFFFNHPTSWVHESSGYILAAYSLLAGGYALHCRSHVNVDILVTRLSPRKQRIISLFTWLLFFFYIGIIIWRTGEASIFSIQIWEHSPSIWGPLFWPVRLLIPIGGILILLQGIAQFIGDLIFVVKGEGE